MPANHNTVIALQIAGILFFSICKCFLNLDEERKRKHKNYLITFRNTAKDILEFSLYYTALLTGRLYHIDQT